VNNSLNDSLELIRNSFAFFLPELLLSGGLLVIIFLGLIYKDKSNLFHFFTAAIFVIALGLVFNDTLTLASQELFSGAVKKDSFTDFLKLLFNLSGFLTVLMTWNSHRPQNRLPEYYALILTLVLSAHLLVMSQNLLFLFLSLELVSISSYILTGFAFTKNATEGSLKYFIFGSVSSAVMLYGFSLLYGIAGTVNFTTIEFVNTLSESGSGLLIVAAFFSLAGFLYKIAAAPMHPWAPDVYEAASMPVVAIFSVVPKLAGLGILAKFLLALQLSTQIFIDWQFIFVLIICLTLTIGNFSALNQKNVKRLMAYSSIAQSGFLLIGIVSFSDEGIDFFLFYASVYLIMNYLVFIYLQYFEKYGFTTIADYSGLSRNFLWPSLFMVVGFIGLTGLPPTAGFTGKLFLFSGLWEAYAVSNKPSLLILFVFGLLNTVISLFYYLRIPYYCFIKTSDSVVPQNNLTLSNLLGLILVLLILLFFFSPGLLMGWINKINFAF
jgi:NADH-quinone oxidoreductase subunit N